MSVALQPSSSLGFRRPLAHQTLKRTLTITNHNTQPVAFKVKTTAPKLYCVRPNSGRVEPGENVDVSVMLQAMKEEPPLNAKCKDKFLIQSTLITPEKETMALQDIWSGPEVNEDGKVYQQKLRVTFLAAEGQIEEEDEQAANASERLIGNDSELNADRQSQSVTNGVNGSSIVDATPFNSYRPPSPHFLAAHEETHDHIHSVGSNQLMSYPSQREDEQALPLPVPAPIPSWQPLTSVPETTTPPSVAPIIMENPVNQDLLAKYNDAQLEIGRLRHVVATMSVTSAEAPDLRRRTRALSDDGSVAETDVQTVVEEGYLHQDGVPLQVVVIISLAVFITTYLFF